MLILNKSGRLVVTVIEVGEVGEGGVHIISARSSIVIAVTCQYLPVFADIINNKIKIRGNNASKEKHSLTRKLVGYRNWSQRLCKNEGN